jgi:hypothetical protein
MFFESKAHQVLKLSLDTAHRLTAVSERITAIVHNDDSDLNKLSDIYAALNEVAQDVRKTQAHVGAEQAFAVVGWKGNRVRP